MSLLIATTGENGCDLPRLDWANLLLRQDNDLQAEELLMSLATMGENVCAAVPSLEDWANLL